MKSENILTSRSVIWLRKTETGKRENQNFIKLERQKKRLRLWSIRKKFATWSDERLCVLAEHNGDWTKGDKYVEYIIEAKRRGLGCGVVIKTETEVSSGNYSNSDICGIAWSPFDKQWKTAKHIQQYVQEAKRRGLDCVVEEELPTQVATKNTPTVSSNKNSFITPLINNDGLSKLSDWVICYQATDKGNWTKHSAGLYYIEEAKRRGLGCGVEGEESTQIATYNTFTPMMSAMALGLDLAERDGKTNSQIASTNNDPKVSSQELEVERQKREQSL